MFHRKAETSPEHWPNTQKISRTCGHAIEVDGSVTEVAENRMQFARKLADVAELPGICSDVGQSRWKLVRTARNLVRLRHDLGFARLDAKFHWSKVPLPAGQRRLHVPGESRGINAAPFLVGPKSRSQRGALQSCAEHNARLGPHARSVSDAVA